MILDSIFGFIFLIPNMVLDSMHTFSNLLIPADTFDWWNNVIKSLGYVFPVHTLMYIFTISFTLKSMQILWALFNKIKGIFWASS